MTIQEKKTCKNCGGEAGTMPTTKIFGLWGFELIFVNHRKRIYTGICEQCLIDAEQEPRRLAYDTGYSDGQKDAV